MQLSYPWKKRNTTLQTTCILWQHKIQTVKIREIFTSKIQQCTYNHSWVLHTVCAPCVNSKHFSRHKCTTTHKHTSTVGNNHKIYIYVVYLSQQSYNQSSLMRNMVGLGINNVHCVLPSLDKGGKIKKNTFVCDELCTLICEHAAKILHRKCSRFTPRTLSAFKIQRNSSCTEQ